MNTTAMDIAMRATRALEVLSSRRVGQFGQWVYVGCLPEASADWRCDHLFSSRTELFSSARSFDRGRDNLCEYYARASGFR